jgi:hypothetical protein
MTRSSKPATSPTALRENKCKEPSHALVGAGLHFKDADDCVKDQAVILAVIPSGNSTVGDLALIQYFDWMMGDPCTRRLLPLSALASTDRWVLYASVEEMKDHYERIDKYRDRRNWETEEAK